MTFPQTSSIPWGRVRESIERVQQRRERAVAALEAAGIPYAIAGGNAVAAWVATVDPSATRFTRDVDLLVARNTLDAVRTALEAAGFRYRHASGLDVFVDGKEGKAGDGVHLVFAAEQLRPEHPLPSPSLEESKPGPGGRLVTLDALVRLKLNAYRRKDQMHLLDMINVGLLDQTWLTRVAPEHRDRLQALLDDPDG